MKHSDTEEFRERLAAVEAQRVPFSDVARWFAPWILAGVLALIFAAGLWCASSAADTGAYAIGLAAAALAFLALLWELGAALGPGIGNPLAGSLVDDDTSLVVLLALLIVMAVGGLILAARAPSPAASGAGYGLFIFGLVFICANLKHYFDRREP